MDHPGTELFPTLHHDLSYEGSLLLTESCPTFTNIHIGIWHLYGEVKILGKPEMEILFWRVSMPKYFIMK